MQIARFPLTSLQFTDRIIADYLQKSPALISFISDFPSEDAFQNVIEQRRFPINNRLILADELTLQYHSLSQETATRDAIEKLRSERTFTVTTGHQLCLFTGPMYFIFKIISTIKLAETLRIKFPEFNFVPVYWMASEDHDFEEINHVWIQGKKIEWTNNSGGAVGRLPLKGLESLLHEFESLLPESSSKEEWMASLRTSFSKQTLSEAIQNLVHSLFGEKGLLVLNPDSPALKRLFAPTMRTELTENKGDTRVSAATQELQNLGYKTLVHARAINLFYLGENYRGRIEKNESTWTVVSQDKQWNESELQNELTQHPENFSPNVAMRPLYQETILPNIAYVGGPGEISYWMQFKSNFDYYNTPFPLLILRDSALILNARQKSKLQKTGLDLSKLFLSRNEQVASILPIADTEVQEEKNTLSAVYDELRTKAKAIDPTLEAFVNAEKQKQLLALENVEKKMSKALKQREEVKIQQLDKILDELFPNGKLNERRDNIFPLLNEFGSDLLNELHDHFDPIQGELKVLQED
ncbi:MAG: bacillithiol biosynthesis cysteine-adding enzyme BshC [Flavobacteriales bacterium]